MNTVLNSVRASGFNFEWQAEGGQLAFQKLIWINQFRMNPFIQPCRCRMGYVYLWWSKAWIAGRWVSGHLLMASTQSSMEAASRTIPNLFRYFKIQNYSLQDGGHTCSTITVTLKHFLMKQHKANDILFNLLMIFFMIRWLPTFISMLKKVTYWF